MVYGTDPFSAQNATNDANSAPSIFGALPYPLASSANPPLHSLVTFRFTFLDPGVLNCSVVGPNNETYYRVATNGQGYTVLRNAAGQSAAVIEWRSHPTIDAPVVGVKQYVGRWLQLSPDRRCRTMNHCGVQYSWAPIDRFLHLIALGSSEWLARVTKAHDAVVLELSARAIELNLIDVAVLGTTLLQSGRSID